MPKEKRNNLAIYTLAASILVSSVLVSMNQVNAHSSDTARIRDLANCVNTNFFRIAHAGEIGVPDVLNKCR